MHDLIAKLEKLTGPATEMDAEICIALQYGGGNSEGAMNVRTDPDWEGDILFEIGTEDCCNPIPELTASLDAAIALVERALPADENADHQKSEIRLQFGDFGCDAIVSRDTFVAERSFYSSASTPAIALLIALLKAKEAQDG